MATTVPPGRTALKAWSTAACDAGRVDHHVVVDAERRGRRRAARRPRPGAGGGPPGRRSTPRWRERGHRAQPDAAAPDHQHPLTGFDRARCGGRGRPRPAARRARHRRGGRRWAAGSTARRSTSTSSARPPSIDTPWARDSRVRQRWTWPARHRSHPRQGVCGSTATSVPSSSTPANSWPSVTGIGPHSIRCRSDPQMPADRTRTRTRSPSASTSGTSMTAMPSVGVAYCSHGPHPDERVSGTVDLRSLRVTGRRTGEASVARSSDRPGPFRHRIVSSGDTTAAARVGQHARVLVVAGGDSRPGDGQRGNRGLSGDPAGRRRAQATASTVVIVVVAVVVVLVAVAAAIVVPRVLDAPEGPGDRPGRGVPGGLVRAVTPTPCSSS